MKRLITTLLTILIFVACDDEDEGVSCRIDSWRSESLASDDFTLISFMYSEEGILESIQATTLLSFFDDTQLDVTADVTLDEFRRIERIFIDDNNYLELSYSDTEIVEVRRDLAAFTESTTVYGLDERGRVSSKSSGNLMIERYEYNDKDQLIKVYDSQSTSGEFLRNEYTYDEQINPLTAIPISTVVSFFSSSDPSLGFSFDPRKTVPNNIITTSSLDESGQITFQGSQSFEYNSSGLPTRTIDSTTSSLEYNYDCQ